MKWVRANWRLLVVASLVSLGMVAFRAVGAQMNILIASLIGALPVALAARLYGPRVAATTLLVEVLLNVDLMVAADRDTVSGAEIAVGIALCVLGIAAGSAFADKQHVSRWLLTEPVTGLANREGLVLEMERLMKRGDERLTLAMVHVPELTEISETFGHEVGIEVLRTITQRIRGIAGSRGLAVKGVRDLFAVVWAEQPMGDTDLATAMITSASGVFDVQGTQLELSAHAAVGRWAMTGGTTPDDIIRATRTALDRAGQTGRAWLAAERATDAGRSRLEIVSELRYGIAHDQLRLHYQPILELPSRSLRGFEALVRWEHPTRGLVPPAEFIPLAEQSGLIVPLTEWVLHEVMRQMYRWDLAGIRPQISVNVGAKVLATPARLPDLVERLLNSYGVEPARLVIEVTESDVMTDANRSVAVLRALKKLGVRIEMDDFGTGYSSLSYLRQLPLDGVKIDRSFVRTLLTDMNTAAIVRAAIELSHALGLEAVAEGVEDEAVLSRLQAKGCDSAQGYLFAKPMPAVAVPAWIASTGTATARVENDPMPVATEAEKGLVLLVDDDPRLRVSTHRMLSAGGFQVLSVGSASEALQVYAGHREEISVVLTDMHLTDWRGHELAKRLREWRPELRVVFMSGDATELRNAGTAPFLQKPFSKHELLSGIGQALIA
jgi:EAL domain-containing protein (putative c-di-GMP-specific phosphodiesterase class I)/CheY-like chemotaxis protein/GGDEF domain-containing protein